MTDEIKKAVEVLRAGGVILYPTDTVWGIGCDATNEEAVKRIFEIKKRADAKAMLVLIDELAEKPLTIIYPEARNLAKNLIADDNSIGIRVTSEPFSKNLCTQFRKPIVSTSANVSGEPTPINFNQISAEIKNAVDYVVNFRQADSSQPKPSSIIKLGKGNLIQIIRE